MRIRSLIPLLLAFAGCTRASPPEAPKPAEPASEAPIAAPLRLEAGAIGAVYVRGETDAEYELEIVFPAGQVRGATPALAPGDDPYKAAWPVQIAGSKLDLISEAGMLGEIQLGN